MDQRKDKSRKVKGNPEVKLELKTVTSFCMWAKEHLPTWSFLATESRGRLHR